LWSINFFLYIVLLKLNFSSTYSSSLRDENMIIEKKSWMKSTMSMTMMLKPWTIQQLDSSTATLINYKLSYFDRTHCSLIASEVCIEKELKDKWLRFIEFCKKNLTIVKLTQTGVLYWI